MQAWNPRTLLKTLVLLSITSVEASSSGSGSATGVVGVPFPSEVATIPAPKALLPNWVHVADPSDDACYRKMFISTNCSGHNSDGTAACRGRAACPINYPVECGLECIQQNADCGLHLAGNVQAAATVVLNAATSGVFGQLRTASKNVQRGVKCGQQLFATLGDIVVYAGELQRNFPNSTLEQVISLLRSSNVVIRDLPTAVSICLGLNVPTDYIDLAAEIVDVVNKVLIEVATRGPSLLDPNTFMTFTKEVGAGDSIELLAVEDTAVLKRLISEGKTCGMELQSVVNKVSQAVAAIKETDATASASTIHTAVGNSNLFLVDIPTVTNNCVQNMTDAYVLRDQIRKALGVITDNVIDASEDARGNALPTADYILKVADMGLDAIALFDPTGIAALLAEYIQPICSPTTFVGEIDNGPLEDALALRTKGDAFAGSHGNWMHAGDGMANVVFESTDHADVIVVIHSAGKTIDKVKVHSGETVTWNSTVANLQNKALYFDRWRPGVFNIAGSGGGSLLLWVPSSSAGGHIELVAKVNAS